MIAQSTWSSTGSGVIYYNPVSGAEKVGINNNNPQYLLDFGTAYQSRMLSLYASGSQFYGLGMSAGMLRFEMPSNTAHSFSFFAGSSEIFKIQSQGLRAGAGISKLGMGTAYGSGLNWGTAYIGFNATRSGTTWTFDTDGGNNGGAVIWSSVGGAIQFASIANNGSATQTKSDAEVFSSVKMVIQNDGKVSVGNVSTASNDYLLFVQKGIATGRVFVNSSYADYVFLPDYPLPTLASVKNHIQLHGHLPGMPSQAEIDAAGGFEVGQIAVKQMEKIEELYLYVLQLHDRIAELEDQIQTTSMGSHE